MAVFWFRRDLRLTDNHGLFKALTENESVLPIFIYDTTILSKLTDKKDRRVDFIHQTLDLLQKELNAIGANLNVFIGKPIEIVDQLIQQYHISAIYCNHDYEPDAIKRDDEIESKLKANGIEWRTFKDQVIFEKNDILKPDNQPYSIFTPYANRWKEKFHQHGILNFPSELYLNKLIKQATTKLPALHEIGFETTNLVYSMPTLHKDIILNYHNTRNLPSVEGTSHLSVHLRFGTVSIRYLAEKASKLNVQWLNELIWREFFMMILYHHPRVVNTSFKPEYEFLEWRNNEAEFNAWCNGKTGYLLVDAGMNELNQTGWMHNRVRMVVASFLSKHLLIDWRWGEAYFAEKLLDFDLSSNNGNWQWAAGTGADAAPYFRIFNPMEQLKRFDPGYDYIKKWIPNFSSYPIQPIVEHSFARSRCLASYKKATLSKGLPALQ